MNIKAVNAFVGHMEAAQARQDATLSKPSNVSAGDAQKIRELSQEFESIFNEIMLSSMRKTIEKANVIDGGNAEDIFRGMLDSEYAKVMSQRGGSGIASAIEKDLLKTMEYQAASSGKAQGIKAYKAESLHADENRATINKDEFIQTQKTAEVRSL